MPLGAHVGVPQEFIFPRPGVVFAQVPAFPTHTAYAIQPMLPQYYQTQMHAAPQIAHLVGHAQQRPPPAAQAIVTAAGPRSPSQAQVQAQAQVYQSMAAPMDDHRTYNVVPTNSSACTPPGMPLHYYNRSSVQVTTESAPARAEPSAAGNVGSASSGALQQYVVVGAPSRHLDDGGATNRAERKSDSRTQDDAGAS